MISQLLSRTRQAAADRKGVTAAEYAILAVGIVIVVGAAVVGLQSPLKNAFSNVGAQISTTQKSVSDGSSGTTTPR